MKHEYYVRDFDGNLTLENTVFENEVSDIFVGTVIQANKQNHIETDNDKQYVFIEDTGDVTIQKDTVSEITLKYVRDCDYTTELPETGGEGNTWLLFNAIIFLFIGTSSFLIATKKKNKE